MIPVITGPTACGKTEVAFFLAKLLGGEIINADSVTVYKYFKIGSSRPSHQMIKEIPHHLVAFRAPQKQFSAGDFVKLALKKIKEIYDRGKTPIICGGTGFYISALEKGLAEVPPSQKLRKELDKKSLDELLTELKKVDPYTFEKIDRKNKRRVLRAVEICRLTGLPTAEVYKNKKEEIPMQVFYLSYPRNEIYRRADMRVEKMIKEGLFEEVKKILAKGIPPDAPPFGSIGYKEALEFVRGEISFEDAVKKIKFRTHNFIRKQIMWWRKKPCTLIDASGKTPEQIANLIFNSR